MTSETMKARLRRVAASASSKKKAGQRKSRSKLIAHLEKEAADSKSRSFDEQSGGGTGSAADQYDRKKNTPSPKGDDPKMEYPWETAEPSPKGKAKQKALDEADSDLKKNTSDMEPVTTKSPSRPRAKVLNATEPDDPAMDLVAPKEGSTVPKLSSSERRKWRRKRIAQLKKALTDEEAQNLDTTDLESEDLGKPLSSDQVSSMDSKAGKADRINAFKLYQLAKKKIPALFGAGAQSLSQANDQLEDAIMSNDIRKMKAAMAMLLQQVQTKSRENMQEMAALGKTIRTVFKGMSTKTASSSKAAARFSNVSRHHAMVESFDQELSRARVLIRMAANRI